MKRFLFSLALTISVVFSNAQVLLNEIYPRTNPSGNKPDDEYFELINLSPFPQDISCYTLVAFYSINKNDEGFYTITFPQGTIIDPFSFYVASVSTTFNYQNKDGVTGVADLNWNDATGGYVKKHQFNGLGNPYTVTGGPQKDVFLKSIKGSGVYAVMLFNGSNLEDYFLGSSNTNQLPSYITDKTSAANPFVYNNVNNGCNLSIDFNSIIVPDTNTLRFNHVNQETGVGNGYSRTCEGWVKTSAVNENTPGALNPGQSIDVSASVTVDDVTCELGGFSAIINGDAGAFPATYKLYQDQDPFGFLGPEDQPVLGSGNINAPGDMINVNVPDQEFAYILVIDTKGACSQDVLYFGQCAGNIVTPVTLESFDAQRNGTNVQLKWETASESNNKGFSIQRKMGGNNWETITFVGSKASGGNSATKLTYTFTDANPAKNLTQYRLQQTDLDGKMSYSEIRSVRGLEQANKVMIFPNPSRDGVVNVVFENASAPRNILISDMVGRMVRQWKGVSSGSLQINNLHPGLYNIRIINTQTGQQNIERVIVQ